MTVLYLSQTCPVNHPDATPVLSVAELWQALHIKSRQPELFLGIVSESRVIEETPTSIKREMTLKEVWRDSNKDDAPWPESLPVPPSPMQDAPESKVSGSHVAEDIELRAPWKIDFYNRTTGSFVNNTISRGKDETDLYLSFYFEWPMPDLKEGEDAKQREAVLQERVKGVVQHTIDVARTMKTEGKLTGSG